MLVAGTLVSAMAGFFADLINGKIDGIDPDNYIPDGMFTGYPTESNAGKLIYMPLIFIIILQLFLKKNIRIMLLMKIVFIS